MIAAGRAAQEPAPVWVPAFVGRTWAVGAPVPGAHLGLGPYTAVVQTPGHGTWEGPLVPQVHMCAAHSPGECPAAPG